MLDPVGFWSYARQDDAHSDGQLSQLRTIVGKALVLQCGVEIRLWQDITAIPYGSDWAATIERTIGETTFFIPIVTPRFLKSQYCHAEFISFRQRMQAMGRNDLIFPIHYVNVDEIRQNETVFGDDLISLRRSQWIDFRPLFYMDPKSNEVRRWAGELVGSALKALRQPDAVRAAPASVSSGQGPSSTASPSNSSASVTIGMVLEPPGLDPTTAPAAAIGEVTHYNIFEGLTKINEDFSVTPLLAEKWDFSPDLKTLTFTLKPNVKFQDGESFSSMDVKFAFERFAAKDSTNKDKAFFASIASIDATNPRTVSLTFKWPSFMALFRLGMNSAVIVNENSAATNATNPIGTGPYRLANWNKGASVTLEKWDGYREASKIAISKATFKFMSDPSDQLDGLLVGDLDVFPRLSDVGAAAQFQNDQRFKVTIGGTEKKIILAINNKKKPLDDLKVRQAIAYAIDRRVIIDGAMSGLGNPIGSHFTPNDPGYIDLTRQYPHDPVKAKALLRAADLTTPLELTLTLPPPDYARKGGEIIKAQLSEVGINAKIENVEWAKWLKNVYTDSNYDLTEMSHIEPLDIGIYALPGYYYQYDNEEFRNIIAKLDAASDLDEYKKYVGEAQTKLAADCVNAFLLQVQEVTVAKANLQGLWTDWPIFANEISAMSWK